MSAILYVGGFPPDFTSADLEKMFAPHGTVLSVRIRNRQDTSPASAYGLVTMGTEDDAVRALEAMTNSELGTQRLTLVHLKDDAIATLGLVPEL